MSGWILIPFFALTFLGIATALVTAWFVMRKYARQSAEESADDAGDFESAQNLLKKDQLSSISVWQALLRRLDFIGILEVNIAQADLTWSVGRFTLLMLLCGAVALSILARMSWVPLWVATGLSWVAMLVPYLHILRRRNRRFERFRQEFPDALDSLARAMRSGYPLLGALEAVADEAAPPVSVEMRKTFTEVNLGMPWDQALANLARRVPLQEVHLFVSALLLHTRTGGKLNDVMRRLSEAMREQVSLSGEVKAIAAHGRMTGTVLTIIPICIAAMMAMTAPAYLRTLIDHPHGKDMIAAAILCLVAAHFIIRKIVDVRI